GNTATSAAPGPQGNGEILAPPAPAAPLTYTFHTAELTVGFTPDLFGGNRRAVESLQAQRRSEHHREQSACARDPARSAATRLRHATRCGGAGGGPRRLAAAAATT